MSFVPRRRIGTSWYNSLPTDNFLEQLGTEYIDLYYQHRVDPTIPIEIVLETLRPFVEAGEIHWLGLSECSVDTLWRAKAVKGLGDKVFVVQMEHSPFTLDIERNGFAAAAAELGVPVGIVAYFPRASGMVTGKWRSPADFPPTDARLRLPRFFPTNFPKKLIFADAIASVGAEHGYSSGQVALAWILAEHPGWMPIPGSSAPARTLENARSAEIALSKEAIEEIIQLAEDAEVAGARIFGESGGVVEGHCVEVGQRKSERVSV